MTTFRRFLNIALVLPLVCVFGTGAASAAGRKGGCGASAGSAISQYCDAIPSATGPSQPRVGTPSVAKTLPHRVVQALGGGGTAQQRLLTLPAARARHHKKHRRHVAANLSGPGASGWSLSLLMILILAAVALALAGIAFERRRRNSSSPRPDL
jgi:hypothetical protein